MARTPQPSLERRPPRAAATRLDTTWPSGRWARSPRRRARPFRASRGSPSARRCATPGPWTTATTSLRRCRATRCASAPSCPASGPGRRAPSSSRRSLGGTRRFGPASGWRSACPAAWEPSCPSLARPCRRGLGPPRTVPGPSFQTAFCWAARRTCAASAPTASAPGRSARSSPRSSARPLRPRRRAPRCSPGSGWTLALPACHPMRPVTAPRSRGAPWIPWEGISWRTAWRACRWPCPALWDAPGCARTRS
mmetsp:Transcript_4906/g.16361  ORF Transcript_4906/g.16361 Transcript_4906/m.16361 type:complete len:252 (-) Transcript_4906:1305-2060(-)